MLTWDEGELRLGVGTLSFQLNEFIQDVRVCYCIINLQWTVVWKLLRFLLFFTCALEKLHMDNLRGNMQFHISCWWVISCDKSIPPHSTRHIFSGSSNSRNVCPGRWWFVSQQRLGNVAKISLPLHWALRSLTVRHCPLSQKWDKFLQIFKCLTPTEAHIWTSPFKQAPGLTGETEGVKWGDKGCTESQWQSKKQTPFPSGCWKACRSDPGFVASEAPSFTFFPFKLFPKAMIYW